MAKGDFTAAVEYQRLPGKVTWGSNAFYKKVATQDARLAMAQVIKQYADLIGKLKGITPTALRQALTPTFKRAQFYVPEKTGALWESGKLTVETGKSGKPVGRITFGNAEAWYAALVHEYTWLAHQAPTRSKYLQAAMEENVGDMLRLLAIDYTGVL